METTEEGWVTGPALEILLALKALQVGDQIVLGGDLPTEGIDESCRDSKATVYRVHHDDDYGWPYSCQCECGNRWAFREQNVTAWKRPKKVG